MSTEVEATATATSDPLKRVAEAMKSAAGEGMDGECHFVPEGAGPNRDEATQLLSRVAYNSGYYLSYGVVFPTLFVVNVIPGGSAMVSGIVDGARAANEYVHGLSSERHRK